MEKQLKTSDHRPSPGQTQPEIGHITGVLFMVNQLGAGGTEQQIVTLLKGIDKQLFRVLVVTLYPGGASEPAVKQIPGVELICLNRRGKYDFTPVFRVLRLLRERKIDIIQPFLSPATFFALLPALLARTPVKVMTERCGVRNSTHLGFRIFRAVEDFLGHSTQAAVANSRAGQIFLIERGYDQEKTRVIYNGLNLTRLNIDTARAAGIRTEIGIKPGELVVGVNAWLWPGKGQDIFLRSARIIHEQRPEIHFALLGDGPFRAQLEEIARVLNISDKVIFFGAQQEVGTYLSLFDVAVTSSIDHEGCSNSILEAMALGKPVVATDIGGNRELVKSGNNGLLIPAGDHIAMAEAVLSLVNAPVTARRMGESGQAIVHNRFRCEQMVQAYQDLWSGLLRVKRNNHQNHD